MLNLLFLFVRLAFFRATPDQVPAGRPTLTTAVLLAIAANTVVTYSWYGFSVAAFIALLEVLLNGAFLYGCLALQKHSARFEQSMAAVCGMSAVMALVAWPWALAVGAGVEQIPTWVIWGQWLLMMWSLLIWSRILRLACGFSAIAAAAMSLSYFFFSAVVIASFVPTAS